jgi:hypothetical protein
MNSGGAVGSRRSSGHGESCRSAQKIRGFFHVAMIGSWQAIFTELLSQIVASGLYEASEEIVLSLHGLNDQDRSFIQCIQAHLSKLTVGVCCDTTTEGEFPTLQKIKEVAELDPHEETLFFYVHTKGASITENRFGTMNKQNFTTFAHLKMCSDYWRKYIAHFTIDQYNACIGMLDEYDAVGADLCGNIYVGNFWWSKYSYVRKLPDIRTMLDSLPARPDHLRRFYAERWIGWKGMGRLGCLWRSRALSKFEQGLSATKNLSELYYTSPIHPESYMHFPRQKFNFF